MIQKGEQAYVHESALPWMGSQRLSSRSQSLRWRQAYPKLRICVPHLGFDEITEYRNLIEKYDTLWLDTTMVLTDYFPIKEIVELKDYRLQRIMYGSDFPNIPYAWDRELKWLAESGLPLDDLEWILNKSACDFFNLNL